MWRRFCSPLFFWIFFTVFVSAQNGGDTEPPTATTPDTTYIGVESPLHDDVDRFLGIRFAQPPTGDLRFSPTRPFVPADPQTFATEFGPSCLQESPTGPQSEDCLTLNVFAPKTTSRLLPVMVWFYGGAWVSGGSVLYPGDNIVNAASNDVIVVSVNYRLGALGWAVNDELAQENDDFPTSGNYGMLDMIEGLKWVRDNIQFFGGDPNEVTIFGESAGALCISFLMVSDLSEGLYHRVIMESGVALQGTKAPSVLPWWDADFATSQTDNVIEQLGCSTDPDPIACLRRQNADDFIQFSSGPALPAWQPVVDGFFITDDPLTLFANGEFQDVDVIVGFNTDEGNLFVDNLLQLTREDIEEQIIDAFPDHSDMILSFYDQFNITPPGYELSKGGQTDFFFICPEIRMVEEMRKFQRNGKLFVYHFAHMSSWITCPGPFCDQVPLKVTHSFELPYVFGISALNGLLDMANGAELQLNFDIMTYWSNFGKFGSPGFDSQGIVEWPEFGLEENFLTLDLNIFVDQRFNGPQCDFWKSITPADQSTQIPSSNQGQGQVQGDNSEEEEVAPGFVNQAPEEEIGAGEEVSDVVEESGRVEELNIVEEVGTKAEEEVNVEEVGAREEEVLNGVEREEETVAVLGGNGEERQEIIEEEEVEGGGQKNQHQAAGAGIGNEEEVLETEEDGPVNVAGNVPKSNFMKVIRLIVIVLVPIIIAVLVLWGIVKKRRKVDAASVQAEAHENDKREESLAQPFRKTSYVQLSEDSLKHANHVDDVPSVSDQSEQYIMLSDSSV